MLVRDSTRSAKSIKIFFSLESPFERRGFGLVSNENPESLSEGLGIDLPGTTFTQASRLPYIALDETTTHYVDSVYDPGVRLTDRIPVI
ncbi:MAG: hypothetical protein Q9176_000365 [Flavoplaca citrina]